MRQERSRFDTAAGEPDPATVAYDEPDFMLEVVAQLSHYARRAPEVSQRSGVSVRVSVANLETLAANALRRAVTLGETSASPRISDLGALIPSTVGKIELESLSDEVPEGAHRGPDSSAARSMTSSGGASMSRPCAEVIEAFDAGSSSGPGNRCRRASTCAGCARCPACRPR